MPRAPSVTGGAAHAHQDGTAEPPAQVLNLLLLSGGFFCIFSAFTTFQGLLQPLLEEAGFGSLGSRSLAALYLVFGPACLLAPRAAAAVGPRAACTAASVVYALLCLAPQPALACAARGGCSDLSSAAAAAAVAVGAAANGAAAAVLWVSQGWLLTSFAPAAQLNRYTTVFAFWRYLGDLCGPWAASLALGRFAVPPRTLLAGMAALSFLGTALLSAISPPAERRSAAPPPAPWGLLLAPGAAGCAARRLSAVCAMTGLARNAFLPVVLPQYVAAGGGGGAAGVASCLSAAGVGGLLTGLCFAPLADCFGRRAVLGVSLAGVLCAAGAFAAAQPFWGSLLLAASSVLNYNATDAIIGTIAGELKADFFALRHCAGSVCAMGGLLLLPTLQRDAALAATAAPAAAALAWALSHAPLHAGRVLSKGAKDE